jgi:hypothetical protein
MLKKVLIVCVALTLAIVLLGVAGSDLNANCK